MTKIEKQMLDRYNSAPSYPIIIKPNASQHSIERFEFVRGLCKLYGGVGLKIITCNKRGITLAFKYLSKDKRLWLIWVTQTKWHSFEIRADKD